MGLLVLRVTLADAAEEVVANASGFKRSGGLQILQFQKDSASELGKMGRFHQGRRHPRLGTINSHDGEA